MFGQKFSRKAALCRHRRRWLEQLFHVFSYDVALKIDDVALAPLAEHRLRNGVGNGADGKILRRHSSDCETDAIDGDAAFLDNVTQERGVAGDGVPDGCVVAANARDATGAVTWPLTMCPPKRPFAAMARSRLTGLPLASSASDERSSVSCITSRKNSAAKAPSPSGRCR